MRADAAATPTWWWAAAGLTLGLGAASLLLDAGTWRLIGLLIAALWGPGAAVVGLVPRLELATRVAVTPAVSMSFLLLGSTVMVQAGAWHPQALLVGLGLAALAPCLWHPRGGRVTSGRVRR